MCHATVVHPCNSMESKLLIANTTNAFAFGGLDDLIGSYFQ